MTESIIRRQLPNGMELYLHKHPGAQLTTICAGVRTGSIHEAEMLGCGVSHYLEHLLFQGCEGYPGDDASRTINRLGGDFNAYTSYTHTVFYTELPSANCVAALDVLVQMLRAPEIPEAKFQSERQVILRECDLRDDVPGLRLEQALWVNTYQKHPVRHPIIGYRELIAGVTRDMLLDYHRRRYTPGRVFFVVSGAVDPDEIADALTKRVESWPRSFLAEAVLPLDGPQLEATVTTLQFPDPVARLGIVYRLPEASDPCIPAADLLSGLLGQNASSVLVHKLWRERELAVQFRSFAYPLGCPGVMGFAAAAEPAKLEALEEAIFAELAEVARTGFTPELLEEEKLRRITDDRRDLKSGRDWAFELTETIAATGTASSPEAYHARLAAVTSEELQTLLAGAMRREQSNVIRMAPENRAAKNHPLPEVEAGTLKRESDWTAAPVITCSNQHSGLIDWYVLLPGGSSRETTANNGITQVLAAALPTGAGDFDESALAEHLDRHALELNITPGVNSLMIHLNAPKEAESTAWEMLHLLLTAPRFDRQSLKRECANFIESLKSRGASAVGADDLARKLLFGNHPFGLPRGDVAAVKKLKPETMRDFYRRLWHPAQTVFGIGGAFDAALARERFAALNAALAWSPKTLAPPPEPEFPAEPQSAELEVAREQCRVMYILPGMAENDPERLTLELLLQAENGLSAHLFRVIREERSLAYSTSLTAYCGWQRGFFAFSAGCEYAKSAEVAELLRQEADYLAQTGLTQEEFDAAKLATEVRFRRRREDGADYLANAMFSEYFGLGFEEMLKQEKELEALDCAAVNATLRRCFADAVGVTVATVAKA